jgi:hypothetical protein
MKPQRTPWTLPLLALILVSGVAPALAAQSSFSVGAQVVASAPADRELLTSVPVPTGAAVMAVARGQRHHVFEGNIERAAGFFRATLPAQGWRLVQLGGDAEHWQEQVWESARGRVVVRLQAALSSVAATRISLSASAPRQRL